MAEWQHEVIGQHVEPRLFDLTHQQTSLGTTLLEDASHRLLRGRHRKARGRRRAAHARQPALAPRQLTRRAWQWGRLHQAHWRHPVGDAAFDIGPSEVDGGSHTLRNTGGELPPHAASSGAEYRIVVDFAKPGLVPCRAEYRQLWRAQQSALSRPVRALAAR